MYTIAGIKMGRLDISIKLLMILYTTVLVDGRIGLLGVVEMCASCPDTCNIKKRRVCVGMSL